MLKTFSLEDRRALVLLVFLSFPFWIYLALQQIDAHEALYAQQIDELLESGSIYPTYFGQFFYYKPPLMIYTYSAIILPASHLPLPLELTYRIPSLLFGALSILLLYLLVEKLLGKDVALVSCAAFSFTNCVVSSEFELLTDTLANFLILLSVYLYVHGGKRDILLAWVVSALAFLTKGVFSLMIPVLAIAYFAFNDRKKLATPGFLLSLTGPLFGFVAYYLLLVPAANSQAALGQIRMDLLGRVGPTPADILFNFQMAMRLLFPWLVIAVVGAFRAWGRGAGAFSVAWAALIAIPLFSRFHLVTYFLPIAPAVSILAGIEIVGKKLDRFSVFVVFLLAGVSVLPIIANNIHGPHEVKEAAAYIAGKQDVLLITHFSSNLMFYKSRFEESEGSFRVTQLLPCDLQDDYSCLAEKRYSLENLDYYIVQNRQIFPEAPKSLEFGPTNASYILVEKDLGESFANWDGSSGYSLDMNFSGEYFAYRRV